MNAEIDSWGRDLGPLRFSLTRRDFLHTLIVASISTAAAMAVDRIYGEVAAALIFMLGISVAGAVGGLASALVAAAGTFFVYNFFITEPQLTFRLATGRDLAPLVIFNMCAVVTGVLAGRLHDRTLAALDRNTQLQNLLKLGRALQSAGRPQDVIYALATTSLPDIERMSLFVPSHEGGGASGSLLTNTEAALARAALAAEDGLSTIEGFIALRLQGADGPLGALVLVDSTPGLFDNDFAQALGNMVTLAIERAALAEQVAERAAAVRTEELKSALLSSVSHDFRTPLAAISASASSMLDYGDKLDHVTQSRLLRGIVDECERLNRFTTNLLELSKLEAGAPPTGLQLMNVAEMIGVAVQRARGRAPSRKIRVQHDDPELLVRANPALFDLVLTNVLENAILYSAAATQIVVTTAREDCACRIGVADAGSGIPEEERGRIFDRFYRVRRPETAPRGSGLGLAIAKGFTEALSGSIEARGPGLNGCGTEIVIRLPLVKEGTY